MRSQTTNTTPHFFRPMTLFMAGAVFLALAVGAALGAGKPSIKATLVPAQIAPGGVAAYTITIEGGTLDDEVRPDLGDGVQIAAGPAVGTQIRIINGVSSTSITLTWQITSTEPGDHIIPAQEVHLNGVPVASNEVKLVVKDGPAPAGVADGKSGNGAGDPLMTIETEKKQFYVGEVIPVTVNLYLNSRTLLRRIGLIELPKDSFAVQRFPTQSEENTIMLGGQQYSARAFNSTLSGLKPGKFKFGPATMEITVEERSNSNSGFNMFFGQPGVMRKIKPPCNDIDLTVLPLPTEGRPKNFSGVVGDFQLSVTADPHELAVGDPIAAELTISGTGNFDTLTVPALTDAADWKVYPARRFNIDGTGSANIPALDGNQLATQRIGFTQVIIPKKKLASIPSFEFSYFSPTKKQYLTLRTEPVPLNIKEPERPAEAAPKSATTGNTTSPPDEGPEKVNVPKTKITDILTVTPTHARWLKASKGIWVDQPFRKANLIIASVLAFFLLAKITGTAVSAWMASASTPHQTLWRGLKQSKLPRAQFYQLAAALIQNHHSETGSLPEPLSDIIRRHETLNFARHQSEAEEDIPSEERMRVLEALKPLV